MYVDSRTDLYTFFKLIMSAEVRANGNDTQCEIMHTLDVVDGEAVGSVLGSLLGWGGVDGELLGDALSMLLGSVDGTEDGCALGILLGSADGDALGLTDVLGSTEGAGVGEFVGSKQLSRACSTNASLPVIQ